MRVCTAGIALRASRRETLVLFCRLLAVWQSQRQNRIDDKNLRINGRNFSRQGRRGIYRAPVPYGEDTDLLTAKKLYGSLALSVVTTAILWRFGVRTWEMSWKIAVVTIAAYFVFALADLARNLIRMPVRVDLEKDERIRGLLQKIEQLEAEPPESELDRSRRETVEKALEKLSPVSRKMVEMILTAHEMEHTVLASRVRDAGIPDIAMGAFGECRSCDLLVLKLASPVQHYDLWTVNPMFTTTLEKHFLQQNYRVPGANIPASHPAIKNAE
jgi:hypothetical protein